MTKVRNTTGNRRLAKKRVQWLIEHSTSYQLLCWFDGLVLRNPLLRQAENRCKQPLTNRTCKMKENIKIFGSYKLRVNSDILLPKKKAKHKEESKSRKRKNSKV